MGDVVPACPSYEPHYADAAGGAGESLSVSVRDDVAVRRGYEWVVRASVGDEPGACGVERAFAPYPLMG